MILIFLNKRHLHFSLRFLFPMAYYEHDIIQSGFVSAFTLHRWALWLSRSTHRQIYNNQSDGLIIECYNLFFPLFWSRTFSQLPLDNPFKNKIHISLFTLSIMLQFPFAIYSRTYYNQVFYSTCKKITPLIANLGWAVFANIIIPLKKL